MSVLWSGVSTWQNSILLRPPFNWLEVMPAPRKQKFVLRKPYICEWCRQQNELCVSKNATTIIVWLFVGEGYTQIIPSSNSSTLRLKNTFTSGRRKTCFLFVTRLPLWCNPILYCFRWEVPRAKPGQKTHLLAFAVAESFFMNSQPTGPRLNVNNKG